MNRYVYQKVTSCISCPFFNEDGILCENPKIDNIQKVLKDAMTTSPCCPLPTKDPVAEAQEMIARKFL